MRRLLTWAGVTVGAVLAAAFVYDGVVQPERVAPADIRVAITPARISRGAYLYTLADCDGCHSERDFSRFAGPVVPEGRGKGFVFPASFGLPGRVAGRNITPDPETGLGQWSDGEKIRAIRDGISRDGRPLFPLMPYTAYRNMSDEDVRSLVAYLNTLPPIRNPLPETAIRFPVSVLVRSVPKPAGEVRPPDRANPVRYGEYLATIGGCVECHTQAARGKLNTAMLLAGGREFRLASAVVVSANITPDKETGIGAWSEQDFLNRVYAYRKFASDGAPAVGPESFTVMPWLNHARLAPEDLKAIYAWLHEQKPVRNFVDVHPQKRLR